MCNHCVTILAGMGYFRGYMGIFEDEKDSTAAIFHPIKIGFFLQKTPIFIGWIVVSPPGLEPGAAA